MSNEREGIQLVLKDGSLLYTEETVTSKRLVSYQKGDVIEESVLIESKEGGNLKITTSTSWLTPPDKIPERIKWNK